MALFESPYNCVSCGRPKTRTEDDLCEQCKEEVRGAEKQTMNIAVLKKAIATYGVKAQVDMAIEEMSELTKALCKERRCEEDHTKHSEAVENIIEEIADVAIMLRQMMIIFDRDDEVEMEIKYKTERLARRLAEAERK